LLHLSENTTNSEVLGYCLQAFRETKNYKNVLSLAEILAHNNQTVILHLYPDDIELSSSDLYVEAIENSSDETLVGDAIRSLSKLYFSGNSDAGEKIIGCLNKYALTRFHNFITITIGTVIYSIQKANLSEINDQQLDSLFELAQRVPNHPVVIKDIFECFVELYYRGRKDTDVFIKRIINDKMIAQETKNELIETYNEIFANKKRKYLILAAIFVISVGCFDIAVVVLGIGNFGIALQLAMDLTIGINVVLLTLVIILAFKYWYDRLIANQNLKVEQTIDEYRAEEEEFNAE
jgi:hypothetical protein